MSQQELDRGDLEVMGMVNGHSTPEASAAAEQIVESVNTPVAGPDEAKCAMKPNPDNECLRAAEHSFRKRLWDARLRLALFVAACFCAAAALVAAWYVPALLIWVVNMGVLFCGIAATAKISNYVRRWR